MSVAAIPSVSSGKSLRACKKCLLLKTLEQFKESGCENCDPTTWKANTAKENTTQEFTGFCTMLKPRESWVAKWQRQAQLIAGVYALNLVHDGEEDDDYVDEE